MAGLRTQDSRKSYAGPICSHLAAKIYLFSGY